MNGFVKVTGISAVLAAAGVLCGAESIAPQTLSDWAGVNQNVTQDAEGVITMKPKSTTISSKKAITVDPAKTYKLSGKFRKVPGSTVDTRIYFGLASCDEKGNPIPSGAVIVMPNTDTVLADAVKKGDKVIKVKDASKWDKRNFKIVAFNTKADLSDLPNRTFSSNITKLERRCLGNHPAGADADCVSGRNSCPPAVSREHLHVSRRGLCERTRRLERIHC